MAVDQPPGQAEGAGQLRQFLGPEPAGVDDLGVLDPDLARSVARVEADHQLARKGPGLAGEVGDRLDLDADLLLDLPGDGLLERFARFDEAGQAAVEGTAKELVARQQQLALALHQHDHGGVDAREVGGAAARTAAGALLGDQLGRRPAAAAEGVARIPLQDLEGASGDAVDRLFEAPEEITEAGEDKAVRQRRLRRQGNREAGPAVQPAQVEVGGRAGQRRPDLAGERRLGSVVVAPDQETPLVEGEDEGVRARGRLEVDLGLEAAQAVRPSTVAPTAGGVSPVTSRISFSSSESCSRRAPASLSSRSRLELSRRLASVKHSSTIRFISSSISFAVASL